MIVYRQVTEHDTEIVLRESDEQQDYVEVMLLFADAPVFLSLTPAEAQTFADALLSSSQRVYDRQPHGNS